jgi:predicted metalloprotease
MLDSGSSAVRVRVTEVVFVYMSPSLISMDPVGGVLSFAPLTSNKPALKNEVREKSSNRIRTNNESVLLLILQPLIIKAVVTGNMRYESIFYKQEVDNSG